MQKDRTNTNPKTVTTDFDDTFANMTTALVIYPQRNGIKLIQTVLLVQARQFHCGRGFAYTKRHRSFRLQTHRLCGRLCMVA